MIRFHRGLLAALPAAALMASPAFAKPVTIVLQLNERVPLTELANNVTEPSAPRYAKPYTSDEIRALAGPSETDYAATLAAVRQAGLEVTHESPTHLWISARADHTVLEQVFNTKFKFTRDGSFTVSAEPRNPFAAVKQVSGFDSTRKRVPLYTVGRAAAPTAAQPGLLPAQIKTAYGLDPLYKAGWTGKGQHIAIATYDGFHMSDITAYYGLIKLATAPTVDQVQFNGTPAVNEGSAAETQLDAEFSGMMAPGSSVHIFASAENSDAGELAMFTAILDDGRAKVVNYSWGACETQTTPAHMKEMDPVFARAVAQGVNIMVASGDSGADSCQNGSKVADWPAAHPNVVAVGGTTIKLNSDNSMKTETAWKMSGGGISDYYNLPDWQTGVLSTMFIKRSYPDVSFNADNKSGEAIWTHYGSITAHWLTIGGTSMASPQWAGILALINEARVAGGGAEVGFLNPLLYKASAAEHATMFRDITSGNNGYASGKGWDAVTGWGSPLGQGVFNYLMQ